MYCMFKYLLHSVTCHETVKLSYASKFLTDINECHSDPCQNGATCVDGDESYTCTCETGWAGVHCENSK